MYALRILAILSLALSFSWVRIPPYAHRHSASGLEKVPSGHEEQARFRAEKTFLKIAIIRQARGHSPFALHRGSVPCPGKDTVPSPSAPKDIFPRRAGRRSKPRPPLLRE